MERGDTPILLAPSVVIPNERNCLINAKHKHQVDPPLGSSDRQLMVPFLITQPDAFTAYSIDQSHRKSHLIANPLRRCAIPQSRARLLYSFQMKMRRKRNLPHGNYDPSISNLTHGLVPNQADLTGLPDFANNGRSI